MSEFGRVLQGTRLPLDSNDDACLTASRRRDEIFNKQVLIHYISSFDFLKVFHSKIANILPVSMFEKFVLD